MNHRDETGNREDLREFMEDHVPDESEELIDLWDRLANYPGPGSTDAQRSADVLAAIEARAGVQSRMQLVTRRMGTYWIAAAVVFVAISGGFFLVPVTETAPAGQLLVVNLPDGSSAELNSGTTIKFSRLFSNGLLSNRRTIELNGEAFFDVRPDDRPFTVETFNASVTVVGTSFNVRSWAVSMYPATSVTLTSGRVELADRGGNSVMMSPGETRTVDAASGIGPSDSSTLESAVAWRAGDLLYRDQPLGLVLEDVQRRFGRTISLKVDSLHERRINLSFKAPESAEEVVRTICGAYSLSYRPTATGFEIVDPRGQE